MLDFGETDLKMINSALDSARMSLNQGNIPSGDKHAMFDLCDSIVDNVSEIKRLIALRKI